MEQATDRPHSKYPQVYPIVRIDTPNRHDGFEVAETGNRLTVRILRHSQRKPGAPARPNLRSTAPVFDPTRARAEPCSQRTNSPSKRKKKDEKQRAKLLLYCGVIPNLLIDSKNHLGATVEMNIAPLGTDYGCIGRS